MAGSLWDMFNWYNWYWWPSDESENDELDESTSEETKPTPKRKKSISRNTKKSTPGEGIQLVLLPSILEELEKEAESADTTLNHLIENILKSHIESKEQTTPETESWKCTYCNPELEFFDYFEYSNHFFKEHMQPNLQKLSEVNSNF